MEHQTETGHYELQLLSRLGLLPKFCRVPNKFPARDPWNSLWDILTVAFVTHLSSGKCVLSCLMINAPRKNVSMDRDRFS